MANIIQRIATAIKAFTRGAQRPRMLTRYAEQARWKGGDLSERDASQRRAIQNTWVFSAIDRKSTEVSSAVMEVIRNVDDQDAEDAEPTVVKNHPFLQILRRPNPSIGRAFLWRFTQMWLDLDGNAYWFICPDEYGRPAEIWPLPSNAVSIVPGDKDRFVDYYEFDAGGMIFRINSEYICHFRYPNPFDVYRGLSPLVAAMMPADADAAMAYWNGALFGENNVMPSVVINLSSGQPDQPIEQADLDNIKSILRAEYQAVERKTAVVSAYKMEVQQLGWSAKDADFLNGRQFSKEEIFVIYGVPVALVDKNTTEANATVARATFKENIFSLLGLMAEQITAQVIIPFYGEEYEVRFQDIRPVNVQLKLQEAAQAESVLTIDELRERYYDAKPLADSRGSKLLSELSSFDPLAGYVPSSLNNPAPPAADSLPIPVRSELRLWREKAVKRFKETGKAVVPFKSSLIPDDLNNEIVAGLLQVSTLDEVKAVFEEAQKARKGNNDPHARLKMAAAREMSQALNDYFAGLNQRIVKVVENDPAGH
jgi:HK97 family phage portal protein